MSTTTLILGILAFFAGAAIAGGLHDFIHIIKIKKTLKKQNGKKPEN